MYEKHLEAAEERFRGKKKKKRRKRRVLLPILLVLLVIAVWLGRKLALSRLRDNSGTTRDTVTVLPENAASTVVEYNAAFPDVGEGAAAVLTDGNTAVLIDCGPKEGADELLRVLAERGITSVDLVIMTHYDADHIGGFETLVENISVKEVWGPDYEADTETYRYFRKSLEKEGIPFRNPEVGTKAAIGGVSLEILGPVLPETEEELLEVTENEYSLFIRAVVAGTVMLFTGDSDTAAEERVVASGAELSCDLYFVSHHGSCYGSSDALLEAMGAEYAVISVGTENDYGHPHEACLRRLRQYGISISRTDESGSIYLFCGEDGFTLKRK